MKIIEIMRVVMINLIQNKFKVLLTSLGIIVGAVTIVMVIAIGQGGEQEVASQFTGLSAQTIYVNPDYTFFGMNTDFTKITKLTEENIKQIMEESTALSGIYLRSSATTLVSIGGQKEYLTITGVTEGYTDISNLSIDIGDDFSQQDMEDFGNVAVIGYGVAQKYFMGSEDAVGRTLHINKKNYRIIGVLNRNADGLQGLSADDTVFLPFGTALEDVLNEYSLPQAVGMAKDLALIPTAMAEIESTLDYYMEDGNSYTVEDAGSRIDAATESARTMKMLLLSVAIIVFIVGGIGIMNVLFVTIKERTREIGILKALGSKKSTILILFLLESTSIGIFGGIVGVAASILFMPIMQTINIPVAPSADGKILAFAFAVLTSTVFGFYPAYKASRLKPVNALNYE